MTHRIVSYVEEGCGKTGQRGEPKRKKWSPTVKIKGDDAAGKTKLGSYHVTT